MRQLAAQLAEAERIAQEAEATLASRAEGIGGTAPGLENNMLSDMHGRHHNYLRISLTERWVGLYTCDQVASPISRRAAHQSTAKGGPIFVLRGIRLCKEGGYA